MSILTKFKRKENAEKIINNQLIEQKAKLVEQLNKLAIDDEMYGITLESIKDIDELIVKKDKKKSKIDSVVISALITTAGLVGVSLASMKYEDDGNIIQHTAGKTAMNKLGR